MKKTIYAMLLALLLCLGALLLTACAGSTELWIGEDGNWYVNGENTGVKAAGTDGKNGEDGQNGAPGTTGKDGVNGQNGAPGTVVSIGENGNWFLDGVDTGIVAVPKKYVVDVKTSVITDPTTGKRMLETMLFYQDGTHSVTTSEMPAEELVRSVSLRYDSFYVGYVPLLQVKVAYVDGTHRYAMVTDDMWVSEKPDFNTVGSYDIGLVAFGRSLDATVTVTNPGAVSGFFYGGIDPIALDTPAEEVGVWVTFYGGNTRFEYQMPLTAFNSSYDGKIFDTVGEVQISCSHPTLGSYGAMVNVYHPALYNIQEVTLSSYSNLEVTQGDEASAAAALGELLQRTATVHFFKAVNGDLSVTVPITERMLDMSEVDATKVGVYPIKVNVTVEGQGTATAIIYIKINAALSGPGNVYEENDVVGRMFGTLTLHENGIMEHQQGQAEYTRSGNVISFALAGNVFWLVLDDTDMTYASFLPAEGNYRTYSNNSIEGATTIRVYEDYVVMMSADGTEANLTMSNEIENGQMPYAGRTLYFDDANNTYTIG